MRTYLKWLLPVLVLGMLSYLAWGFRAKLTRKQEVAERIQHMPTFRAEGINHVLLTNDSLAHVPAVLVFFDPDCDHCQREADELSKKATTLAPAQVLLLSSAPLPALSTFAKVHKLTNVPDLRVAHIDRQVAYDTFGFASVPDVLIYHADGSLAKRFKGETSVEAIRRQL